MLINIQPHATECRYLFTAVILHVSGVTAPIIRITSSSVGSEKMERVGGR